MTHPNMIPLAFDASNVRVIDRNGEPWFVARDVADILGYSWPANAVKLHCKSPEILKVGDLPTLTAIPNRGLTIIPERDVYRLIMRSKLPAAERFEEWVVGGVAKHDPETGWWFHHDHPRAIPMRSRT